MHAGGFTTGDAIISPGPIGKHIFGTATVGERGQIVLPKEAREVFDIGAGSKLIVLGDEAEGIALVKSDVFEQRIKNIMEMVRNN
ncbi:MAG: AbrB/MazE/SpoVT family DNA-binding domain-containing protein [Agathobacter sp.]|nr:AbrB/MazE/SpoVT family DNA-binding domain-containing protein [Agathobacter sp.]